MPRALTQAQYLRALHNYQQRRRAQAIAVYRQRELQARARASSRRLRPPRPPVNRVPPAPGGDFNSTFVGIAKNPVVDMGLNVAGAVFGDPELGQQVAAIAPLVAPVLGAVGSVIGGIGDALFGGAPGPPATPGDRPMPIIRTRGSED